MERNYNIPEWNKTKFEKYIKSLQRKGLNVKCENHGEVLVSAGKIDYICTNYTIEDEVLYQESGWQFIGTIEHKENGNIIRKAVEVEVPEYYFTAPNECEHCHTIRNRIDTYLVRHIEDNEFKQVGKSCLKAYTGLNPSICALAMDLDAEIQKMEMDEEEVILGGFNSFGSFRGFDAERIKRIAYVDIKANGYIKANEYTYDNAIKTTKDKVTDLYYVSKATIASDEELEELDNWVASIESSYNEYYRNAKTAYDSKIYEYRDLGLVTSLISCYFKDKAKQAERAAKEEARKKSVGASQAAGYLGEVKDKVEFEVAADSILFVNEPYVYGGDCSYTHRIIDTNGHVILWTTTLWLNDRGSQEFPVGTTIKATVKAHKEFRGELQTVVTRGKANVPGITNGN